MEASHMLAVPLSLVLLIGIPVVTLVLLIRAYRLSLRHRQLGRVFEERKLLIEKGVTDLPAIRLPEMEKARDGFGNLKAGVILLVLGAAYAFAKPLVGGEASKSDMALGLIIGAVGFALVLVHFLVRAMQRREKRETGGPESRV